MEALFQCEMKCSNVTVERITNTSIRDYDSCKAENCSIAREMMMSTDEGRDAHYSYE